MKANTITHPKFLRLKRRLKLPTWGAAGVLESLWHFTATHARDGALGSRYSNEDLANAIDWQDDPDFLVSALVESGWLDAHPEHRIVVHDWHEHCPNFVKGNLSKHRKAFVSEDSAKQPAKQAAKEVAKDHAKQAAKEPPKQGATNTNTNTNTNTKEEIPPSSPLGDAEPETAIVLKVPPYNPRTAPLPPQIDTPEFRNAWADWFAYRRERKLSVYKASTIQAKMSEFCSLGVARSIAAIRHSISQNYAGIFEAKESGGQSFTPKPPTPSFTERLAAEQAAKTPVVSLFTLEAKNV